MRVTVIFHKGKQCDQKVLPIDRLLNTCTLAKMGLKDVAKCFLESHQKALRLEESAREKQLGEMARKGMSGLVVRSKSHHNEMTLVFDRVGADGQQWAVGGGPNGLVCGGGIFAN